MPTQESSHNSGSSFRSNSKWFGRFGGVTTVRNIPKTFSYAVRVMLVYILRFFGAYIRIMEKTRGILEII